MSLQLIVRPSLAETSFMPRTAADAAPALLSPAVHKLLQTPTLPPPETVVVIDAPATAWSVTPAWGGVAAGRHRLLETTLMLCICGYFAVGGLMTLLR